MNKVLDALKKYGLEALKIGAQVEFGIPILQGLGKAVAPSLEARLAPYLGRIIQIVASTEVVGATLAGGMTGEQKLAAAAPQVAQVVLDAIGTAKVVDQDAFKKAAELYAEASVQLLKSLHTDTVVVKG